MYSCKVDKYCKGAKGAQGIQGHKGYKVYKESKGNYHHQVLMQQFHMNLGRYTIHFL